jgi:hypothetical protein
MSPVQDLIYWELTVRRTWFGRWVVECPFCGLRWPLPASRVVSVAQVVGAGEHTCEAHHEALAHVLWMRRGLGRKWTGRRRASDGERVGAE